MRGIRRSSTNECRQNNCRELASSTIQAPMSLHQYHLGFATALPMAKYHTNRPKSHVLDHPRPQEGD